MCTFRLLTSHQGQTRFTLCVFNVSQCSLQRPSVLRVKTMDSSTEGSQGNLCVFGNALNNYPLRIRQTTAHKRQRCQNNFTVFYYVLRPKLASADMFLGKITGWLDELQNRFLSRCKLRGTIHRKDSECSFKCHSTSLSLAYVSWLFGTPLCKGNSFFVHRYWFIQLSYQNVFGIICSLANCTG